MLRHPTPHGFGEELIVAVKRDAVFIRFQSILQNILADFAEVKIQVATFKIRVLRVEERVHHPKLHILDIGLFKIGVVHLSHYATPTLLGIEQRPLIVDIHRIEIIGTALSGIIREVESLHKVSFTISKISVGEDFGHLNLAHVRIGQLLEVGTYIARGKRRVALSEHTVNIVPRQQCTVFTVVHII